MSHAPEIELLPAAEAARQAELLTAPNGLTYARMGELDTPVTSAEEIRRLVSAVPQVLAPALRQHAYAFVPLTIPAAGTPGAHTDSPSLSPHLAPSIALHYSAAAADRAVCHRNAAVLGREFVFLSSRLHSDRFALAFEFFINIAHNFVDLTGTPESFFTLACSQAQRGVRGETSIDSWEHRAAAFGRAVTDVDPRRRPAAPASAPVADEKARMSFGDAAFSDALAIYLLSLYLDFDYTDLREREYPLLAPAALADRLRAVHTLFPPNEGYRFEILYRRRN